MYISSLRVGNIIVIWEVKDMPGLNTVLPSCVRHNGKIKLSQIRFFYVYYRLIKISWQCCLDANNVTQSKLSVVTEYPSSWYLEAYFARVEDTIDDYYKCKGIEMVISSILA